jgi:hypothetical protein
MAAARELKSRRHCGAAAVPMGSFRGTVRLLQPVLDHVQQAVPGVVRLCLDDTRGAGPGLDEFVQRGNQ